MRGFLISLLLPLMTQLYSLSSFLQTLTYAGATEDKFHVKSVEAVLVSDISDAESKLSKDN